MLPGYVNRDVPAGIHEYKPSKQDIQRGKNAARSFRYRPQHQGSIEALFLMGSLGTIAHSRGSDLDIWVCHESRLDQNQLNLLQRKCDGIVATAKNCKLDCHFFLMDAENFRIGVSQGLSNEASGSSQHYLLLDEFYRTALWLAGRLPLWWFVPATREQHYQDYRHILLGKRYLAEKKVLDFGPVASIPVGEFAGAALWQLYKAIEAPYKSVFKLLLLEAYTSSYPGFQPLSLSFKQQIYTGELDIDELDPYIVAYRRIEYYLTKQAQPERLELARRCLYFKIDKPLSKAPRFGQKSWQRELLEKLVREWHWNPDKISELDQHRQWKAGQVISERKALVNELLQCYQSLQEFIQQHQINAKIDRQEFTVLGHKLFASYQRRAGKIDWINPGITDELAEPNLLFVQDSGRSFWRVYAGSNSAATNWRQTALSPLKSGSLMELLMWCHCNGLLVRGSHCDFDYANDDSGPLAAAAATRPLIRAIQQWLPLPLPPVAHQSFSQAASIARIFIHINLDTEPYRDPRQQGLYQISDIDDALGYGELKENLVQSVDMVTRNSWNEIDCQRFDNAPISTWDNNALVACLRACLHSCINTDQPASLPEITVHCSSSTYGNTIRYRVGQLLGDILQCFHATKNSPPNRLFTRYIFAVETGFYACQCAPLEQGKIHARIESCANADELEGYLARAQPHPSPLVLDRFATVDDALRLIAKVSAERGINVVYRAAGKVAELTVLDEQGSLFRGCVAFYNEVSLLRSLHYFLRASIKRQRQLGGDFTAEFDVFPIRFYQLRQQQDGRGFLEPCHVTTHLSHLQCHPVQVLVRNATPDIATLGTENLTIVCEQREFSQLQLGDRFLSRVADYLIGFRASAERYPCYITDLDLSAYQLPGLSVRQWQISHYLRFKVDLESRLNAALSTALSKQA